MRAFYNDNDRYVAQWLGNLIAAGHLPPGVVDDRSILEIDPAELGSFRQLHFFAGLGGWPYALQLAGWGDQECWTASCPCQPLSSAGQRRGHADERHLWPALYCLIAECRPATIFGEQVASKDGREWLSGVRSDLEGIGYAVGAANLCAAGVQAKHPRQRLFFVADACSERLARPIAHWQGICVATDAPSAEHGHARIPTRISFEPDPDVIVRIDGLPRPVGQVRAYGNAIVPQVAAEFIRAFREAS